MVDINVNSSNINKCNGKCDYTMFYKKEQNIGTNEGNYININYLSTNSKSAIFIGNEYNVIDLKIVYPSIHSFNNNPANAEIIITHNSNTAQELHVCIPCIISSSPTKGTPIITNIINAIGQYAPSKSGKTSLTDMPNFSIMDIIPSSKFYFYKSTTNINVIVFNSKDAIGLLQSTINTLKAINPTQYSSDNYKYNYENDIAISTSNPINGNVGNDIYIDCVPTGFGEGEDIVVSKKNETAYPLTVNIFSNDAFLTFLTIVATAFVLIALFIIIKYGYLGFKLPEIPSLPK
jgi:hypothetical protein